MRDLLDILAARALSPDRPTVLATIVRVTGSNFRRPGARMLIPATGDAIGALSGGCLEQDIIARANALLLDPAAPARLVYDTSADGDRIFGSGTGCKGRITVALEVLGPAGQPDDWLGALGELLDAGTACTVRTVVSGPVAGATGATPPPATRVFPTGTPPPAAQAFPWSLLTPPGALTTTGTRCETHVVTTGAPGPAGTWELFEQLLPPRPRLLICGATPTARPLAQAAHLMGWRVTVVDWRRALLDPAAFPAGVALEHVAEWTAHDFAPSGGPTSAAVIMTHRWDHDAHALRALRRTPLVYLGLVGARERGRALLATSEADPAPAAEAALLPVESPAGFDLGAEGPEEIAVAIAARLLEAFRHAAPAPLPAPIPAVQPAQEPS